MRARADGTLASIHGVAMLITASRVSHEFDNSSVRFGICNEGKSSAYSMNPLQ